MFFNCDDFFSVFKVKIPNTQYLYIKHTNNKRITQKTDLSKEKHSNKKKIRER